jgi:putative flavoprotein involved in K+ transport
MNVSERSLIGRLMRRTDPFPDRQRNLRQLASLGINVMLRAIGADGQTVRFDNDTTAEISAVVWAIGYEEDNDWLDIPSAKGIRQRVVHTRGRSPVPGLYFLGKPWQRNRSSALIMGAGADAAIIVNDALRHWN